MIQFATVGASALKELIGLLGNAIEDPETYQKIEGLRQFICKVTGKEIDKNGFVALLEGVTQGEPYTGKWENINDDATPYDPAGRRLRVQGGYIYQVEPGTNPILVEDK